MDGQRELDRPELDTTGLVSDAKWAQVAAQETARDSDLRRAA